jgi:hypothetical protein
LIINCQGYEPIAFEELLNKELIKEEDIVNGSSNEPKI